MSKLKICFFTATRAEYGLLNPLMHAISLHDDFQLQLIVSGAHLSPEFGMTVDQIEKDGFFIDSRVEMLLSSDSPVGATKSLGLATIGLADTFATLKPDYLVLLGDRYELLAAASSALLSRIPIIHLHGGETTLGALDECIRHAVTKMSILHFASTETYRQNIINMGEPAERVFNVGAIGLDALNQLELLDSPSIRKNLDIGDGDLAVVTFHPATKNSGSAKSQIAELFNALDMFPNLKIIFTKANADTEGRLINSLLEEYCSSRKTRAFLFSSLGQIRYLSLVKACKVVIGNSSSGIIEVPSLGVPTLNIGDRQKGRITAESTITVPACSDDIQMGIQKALSTEFKQICKRAINPYGDGHTTNRIVSILEQYRK